MNSTFCILGRYLVGGIEGGRVMVMSTRVNEKRLHFEIHKVCFANPSMTVILVSV